ncbi:MAG: hypothetical protein WC069_04175 [Candidatus Shapirobacteria bacterium]
MNKINLIYLWQYLCVILSSLSIYLFWQNTILISLILIIFSILINLKSKSHEIIFFIIISILATIIESFTISSGAWTYSNQHYFNFSIWLPLYWGMGGIAMKNTYFII